MISTPAGYADIQDFVEAAIAGREHADPLLLPSDVWRFSAENFRYVRHLPDFELRRIRYHTYHLTSDWYLTYAVPRPEMMATIEEAYSSLGERLELFPDEGGDGIGFDLGGRRVSWDLIRYMQVLGDLVTAGAGVRTGPVEVLEIGGGYGGVAALLRKANPGIAYVAVDLEETLFFQAVHLANRFGFGALRLCEGVPESLESGKFFLLPQSRSGGLEKLGFDLAINQQSMQEMTRAQVERYCDVIASSCRLFYSCNRDEHSGALARGWGVVRNLTGMLDERFPRIVWKSDEEESGYGDAHLPRRVYVVGS